VSSDPLTFRTLTIPREDIVFYRKRSRLPVPRSWTRYEFFGESEGDRLDQYLCSLITGSWFSTMRWEPEKACSRHVLYFEREDDCVLFVLNGGIDAIAKND
jgi:hypothetical protein